MQRGATPPLQAQQQARMGGHAGYGAPAQHYGATPSNNAQAELMRLISENNLHRYH